MIFLDSGFFIGLMDKKDNHHEDALKIQKYLKTLNEPTVVNTTVLVETLNRSVGSKDDVEKLWDDIYASNTVVHLTEDDYLKSREINGWFDNSINFSDCTIIKTMLDLNINRIVTFDSSFKKSGFSDLVSKY